MTKRRGWPRACPPRRQGRRAGAHEGRPYDTLGGDAIAKLWVQRQAKAPRDSGTPSRDEFQAIHATG